MQHHAGLNDRLEAKFFYFDAISSGRQVGDVIFTGFVGETAVVNSSASVDDNNGGLGNDRLLWVGDPAGERGVGGLGLKENRKHQTEKNPREHTANEDHGLLSHQYL